MITFPVKKSPLLFQPPSARSLILLWWLGIFTGQLWFRAASWLAFCAKLSYSSNAGDSGDSCAIMHTYLRKEPPSLHFSPHPAIAISTLFGVPFTLCPQLTLFYHTIRYYIYEYPDSIIALSTPTHKLGSTSELILRSNSSSTSRSDTGGRDSEAGEGSNAYATLPVCGYQHLVETVDCHRHLLLNYH